MQSNPLISQISSTWQGTGQGWLDGFDEKLDVISRHWHLSDIEPFPNLSYHFVARVKRGEESVVLKLGVPSEEFTKEAKALTAFKGHGCVRLLDFDPDLAAMLIEDVQPGVPLEALWTEEEDERQTTQIAEAMVRLWQAPIPQDMQTVQHWFRYFEAEQPRLPANLMDGAQRTLANLGGECHDAKLLHGDLHHGNLLQSNDGFKAIDPKGVVGDPGFEIYALLHNPVQATTEQLNRLWKSRVDLVAKVTGIDKERLQAWGFCGLMLSACWSVEDGEAPDQTIEIARAVAP